MVPPHLIVGWLVETISPTPLITAATVALVLTIAGYAGLFGIPIAVLSLWGLGNYLFEVVEHRALGRPDWPVVSVETFMSLPRQLWLVQAGVVVLAVLAYQGIKALGWSPLDQLFALFVLISLPASIALLAVTRQPLKAMSPAHLTAAMTKLGLDYILLLLLAAATLYWGLRLISGQGFFNWVGGILCMLLWFNATGRVVYERRLQLGLNPVQAPELQEARAEDDLWRRRSLVLNQLYGLVSRGNSAQGFAELRKYLENEEADTLAARVWFFGQMADWEDSTSALGFGADLISRLVARGDLYTAHKILLRCEHLDSAFAANQEDQAALDTWLAERDPTDLSPP